MAKVLISCIGTGRIIDKTETSKRVYEKAKYAFSETDMIETSFMADALVQHYSIDRVIMIGTVKSMWEEVYRAFCSRNNVEYDDNYALELCQVCEESNSQSALKIPSPEKIENALGKDSKVVLIHYGLNADELQENAAKILGIEQFLNKGDELYIDITHSFRSIPFYMMNLLTYLQFVSNKIIIIKSVLYGMFEAKQEHNGIAPIVEMTSILNVNDWLVGAYSFKEFGNAYKSSQLLCNESEAGRSAAKILSSFSDSMNLNNMVSIRGQSQKLSSISYDGLSPIAKCIIPQVIEDFKSQFGGDSVSNSLFQLYVAQWHYQHKNYATAYAALSECPITYFCEINGLDWQDYDSREEAKNKLQKSAKNTKDVHHDFASVWNNVKEIRNRLMHAHEIGSAGNRKEYYILRSGIQLIYSICANQPNKNAKINDSTFISLLEPTIAYIKKYIKK